MAIGRRASAFASTAVTQVRAGSGRALSTSAAAQQRTYRDTIPNLALGPSSRVLLLNATGRASTLHAKLSLSLGTNIVGGTSSKSTHPDAELSQKFPLFPDVRTAVRELGGVDAAAVFVPPSAAADAVLECIEEEIPTVVAVAEGIPTRDQMRVMAALHSQSKSRYLGANSPGYTNPRGARLGIAPVAAASPGCIGIAARSGTLSYEAMGATKDLGLGQSYCLGLGGDAYPGTRTDEALEFLLNDPTTKGIIIVGEVGGTMEEDVSTYLDSLPSPPSKPIVGFIAGLGVPEGRSYGHSGAIYHDGSAHSALQKRKRWMASGVRVTGTIGETAMAIKEEMDRLGIKYP
ncbi:hypothetical protein L7F22_012844 [Adiantum nelumboides]|nr:hypothetical protein [Adiantum nelumboides]